MSIVSRWVVRQEHRVTAEDLGADGTVGTDAIERWVADARDSYLDRCAVLRESAERSGLALKFELALPSGVEYGRPTTAVVSAGTTEVYPTSFTMAFRVRTYGGAEDIAVSATCVVSLEDPASGEAGEISDAVRDELIALEHAARHTN